ncbi:hypothetical protein MZO42_15485 [Sphingomonas psychrotolerans]|uniref:Tox-REase-5 domain-containing protein n=1 Tax=Sphingomonas psychrotolerans TaxID=1327635 RepID=A0ABU3N6H8_9SPHN|nr:hypothetical protein [Sphingomonas psychrotolerans]MDT8760102.1 hypothetical protein [Sphingomonas psychrotolerans]
MGGATERRHAFSVWLRTGRLPGPAEASQPEFKFNPWHDTRNGRFTFAGAGQFYGIGSISSSSAQDRMAPRIVFKEDPAKPPLANKEEVDAWAAKLLRKYGKQRGFPEAIEAQRRRYMRALTDRAPPGPPRDALGKVADFATGFGEGVIDVGKEVAKGVYALATTNPATSAKNIEFGIARAIDGAVAAEDTPAHVQLKRGAHAVRNASAHDLGHALGTVTGNTALALVPGAVASKISAARRVAKAGSAEAAIKPPKINWVDESTGQKKGVAKDYNDSAAGARSNVATRRSQVPAVERRLPDGRTRPVRFDGIEGEYLVDRKWSIFTTPKAKNQALRQSEALRQNGLTGVWQVPTEVQRRRAVKLLRSLGIANIRVELIEP